MKHTCHLPMCTTGCPPAYLFCGAHWHMVPRRIKYDVYRTVGQRNDHVDATWAPWWRAQAEATAAVMRKLLGKSEGDVDARLACAHTFADRLEGL